MLFGSGRGFAGCTRGSCGASSAASSGSGSSTTASAVAPAVSGGGARRPGGGQAPASVSRRARTASVIFAIRLSSAVGRGGAGAGRAGSASARRARCSAAKLAAARALSAAPRDRASGEAVGARVEQHRALQQEAQEAARLGPGDAERVAGADRRGEREQQRGEPQRRGEVERRDREQAAERGVAEEPAEAVVELPAVGRHVGRGEGGADEQRHRQRDRAADGARLAGVQQEAQAPDGERGGDAVGGPAEGAVQRVGERGADQAEGVDRRGVGGAEQARVVGRVAPDHRRGEGGERDQDQSDELGAAAAQRGLGVALHQRCAPLGPGACRHRSDPFLEIGAASVSRIAASPRSTSAASATSATRM